MPTYKILTTPNCPRFDPLQPRWRRVLGWLRIVPRARFVLMHANKSVMWCHPSSVPSLTKLLKDQGYKFTVQPALAPVPNEATK